MHVFEPHTIVFHPGIGKTATTAVQRAGLALPQTDGEQACFMPFGVAGGAHNGFAVNHPLFDRTRFEDAVARSIAFVRNRQAPTVISSEFLIRQSPAEVAELIGCFSDAGLPVTALFGIREYNSFLMSAYMQALKVGWGMRENETLAEYAAREIALMRYPEMIGRWAKCIGDDKVYLIDYDRNKTRFLSLFFGFVNLSPDAYADEDRQINTSLPIEFSDVLRHFDLVCADPAARQQLIEAAMHWQFKPGVAEHFAGIVKNVTRDMFAHDYDRLSARYTWVQDSG